MIIVTAVAVFWTLLSFPICIAAGKWISYCSDEWREQ